MTKLNRRHIMLALKLVVSVALVGYLLEQVGVEDALDQMLQLDPVWFLVSLGVASLQMVIGVLRWKVVLNALGSALPWMTALRFMYIGSFFNQALPSSVGGDAVRGFLAYKDGMSVRNAVNGVLIDRVVTVLALVALAAVMVPIGASKLEEADWIGPVVWFVTAAAVGGTALLMVLDRLPERFTHLRVVQGMTALAHDIRSVLLKFPDNFASLSVSVLGHVNLSAVVFVLAIGLGIELSIIDCLLLFPPVLLFQTIPISVAGWGLRESAMVALFSLIGISDDSILVLSILYGLIMILISLPGVVIWLMSGRVTMKDAEAFSDR